MAINGNTRHFPILHTERLKLRMADPQNDSDCHAIMRVANDEHAGKGGNSRVGLTTPDAVRKKYQKMGPRPEYCTLAPPPPGMVFLVYLPPLDENGEEVFISWIMLSFRKEMPYPDLGYGTFLPYQRQGYTSEAGGRALQYWRDEIGVKEIWVGTLPDNVPSQACAQRMGLVRGGTFTVIFGHPPNEERVEGAVGLIMPGMKWKDGLTIHPTVGQ